MGTKRQHHISDVQVTPTHLIMHIDFQLYEFNLFDISDTLVNANELQRCTFSINAGGHEIYWPILDESVNIDQLLHQYHIAPIHV